MRIRWAVGEILPRLRLNYYPLLSKNLEFVFETVWLQNLKDEC